MRVVNWSLMRHPMNWLTIWLMLFIAGIALHFVMVGLGKGQPSMPVGTKPAPQQSTGQPPGFSEPAPISVGDFG